MGFVEKCQEAGRINSNLIRQGVLKKKIAKALDLYPSAYSSLVHSVWEPLSEAKNSDVDTSKLFANVNNLSERKVRQSIDTYINILQELQKNAEQPEKDKNQDLFVNTLIDKTSLDCLKLIEGIYYCYYKSSFGYRIKREPLMLYRDESSGTFAARKGNSKSQSTYEGFFFFSNQHTLTVQMQEQNTIVPDHFIAHFSLPPNYKFQALLLKGVAISMSNSYQPISRKVILSKSSTSISAAEYDKEETLFEEEISAFEESRIIIDYLNAQDHILEYYPTPQPNFDIGDLHKEQLVSDAIRSNVCASKKQ